MTKSRVWVLVGIWMLGFGISSRAHDPIKTKVSWDREVAPLIARRCLSCHTRGGFSFPLTSYEEARPWAVAIKEETLAGQMPPWGAAPGIGHFANDRQLTRHEIELIAAWVDGGAPKALPPSNPESQPPHPDSTPNPQGPTPNVQNPRLQGTRTRVPLATTVIEEAEERTASVTLDVPAGLVLTAWSFEPGAATLVERVDLEVGSRWLGSWTPGDEAIEFPDDAGLALGDSALFTARMSYRAPSARMVDQSWIVIWTTKESRPKTVRETSVVKSWRAVNAIDLFGLRPAGTAPVEAVARFADGRIEPLGAFAPLEGTPQPTYRLARPLALPAGARVETTGPLRLLYTDGATRTVKSNVRRRPRR